MVKPMQPLEVIGLDVGEAHTGMARGNTTAKLAEPLGSVPTADVLAKLKGPSAKKSVDLLVIGLPRNLEGKDTKQTAWTRQWAAKVKTELGVPMYWQDEALTSRTTAKHQTSNIKHQTVDEHGSAAAAILQDFLDSPEDMRVPV